MSLDLPGKVVEGASLKVGEVVLIGVYTAAKKLWVVVVCAVIHAVGDDN